MQAGLLILTSVLALTCIFGFPVDCTYVHQTHWKRCHIKHMCVNTHLAGASISPCVWGISGVLTFFGLNKMK